MSIYRYAVVSLLLLLPHLLFAQKQNNIWYIRNGVGIDFNGLSPTLFQDNGIIDYKARAIVADRHTGKLLFYTNGETVWNRSHQPMPNGTGLLGHFSSAQPALVVPMPEDSMRYYVFTSSSDIGGPPVIGINYSIVDMRKNNGLGDVTTKNVHIFSPSGDRLTAVLQCDGKSYWVLYRKWHSSLYYALPVTPTGLHDPIVSAAGIVDTVANDLPYSSGWLTASLDGTKLACSFAERGIVDIMDFDKSSGRVSNSISLSLPEGTTPRGVCFSPDGSKLYVNAQSRFTLQSGLWQYNITSWNPATMQSSRYLISGESTGGFMMLGPDNRIYVADSTLDVIANPNAAGAASGFDADVFNSGPVGARLPNLINGIVPVEVGESSTEGICPGETVQLKVSGGNGGYQWSPKEGLSCVNCPDPIASPKTTTTYHVNTTSQGGCSVEDSVTVHVLPAPLVDAGNDRIVCRGSSIQLGVNSASTYRWSPAIGLSCIDCQRPLANPDSTTIYSVTITNAAGCRATDSVTVRVVDPPIIDAGPDVHVCEGDSVQLSAPEGVSYVWSPSDGLGCFDCRQPSASPSKTTMYHLVVTTSDGCSGRDSVLVTVYPQLVVDAGRDTAICPGTLVPLHASGGRVYQWSPSSSLSCLNCADPIATPTATTTYHVSSINEFGCTATDSITVTVIDPASVDAGIAQAICSRDSVRLSASNGSSWHWTPPDGLSCTDCQNPMASPTASTLYTVTVTATRGCSASDTVSVTVLQPPHAVVTGGGFICPGEAAHLHASGGVSYRWSPSNGLSCADCADPVASPSTSTTYTVTVTSDKGCTATAQTTVTVREPLEIRAHIDTTYRVFPGRSVEVPVVLDQGFRENVDTLSFSLQYNGGMLRLSGVETQGTLLDGWRQETVTDTIGGVQIRFIRGGGRPLFNSGNLMVLTFTAFVGDTAVSSLPFVISFGYQQCLTSSTIPGRITVDSICGLSLRLIEVNPNKYVLKQNDPNPFNPTTSIEFALGLDGPTRLEVMNAAGQRIAVLVDEYLQPGRYVATWDAGEMPSGIYYYRLTSGNWSQTNRMIVVK